MGAEPAIAIDRMGQKVLAMAWFDGRALVAPLDGGTPKPLPRFTSGWLGFPAFARLRAFTNLRVVRDEGVATGYRVEAGPFPGWARRTD